MKLSKILPALVIYLSLISCGSSPVTRYYVLQPGQASTSTNDHRSIGIGPVAVAEYLNHQAIVTTANGQLRMPGLDLWAEPLADGITRVIAENLVAITGSQRVRTFPWRGDEQPEIAIKIDVLALNGQSGQAEMRVHWSLRQPASKQPLDEGYQRYQAVLENDSFEQLAASYSEMLMQFSHDIAQKIEQLPAATTGDIAGEDIDTSPLK